MQFSFNFTPSPNRKPKKFPSESSLFLPEAEKTRALLTNPAPHVSQPQSRVEVTFRSMPLNDNVTDSCGPVTLGSFQPEWASEALRPLEASSVYWHLAPHALALDHPPPPQPPKHSIPILSRDLINPQPLHTWLLILPGSILTIILSILGILPSTAKLVLHFIPVVVLYKHDTIAALLCCFKTFGNSFTSIR